MTDGFEYGAALYRSVPGLDVAAGFMAPVVTAFHSVPFSGLVFFLALSYFVHSRASALSPFVKFNIQQALFLDMVLLVPFLFPEVGNLLLHVAGDPMPLIFCRNFMFYVCASVLGYATLSNIKGEVPDKVPLLSHATREYLSML